MKCLYRYLFLCSPLAFSCHHFFPARITGKTVKTEIRLLLCFPSKWRASELRKPRRFQNLFTKLLYKCLYAIGFIEVKGHVTAKTKRMKTNQKTNLVKINMTRRLCLVRLLPAITSTQSSFEEFWLALKHYSHDSNYSGGNSNLLIYLHTIPLLSNWARSRMIKLQNRGKQCLYYEALKLLPQLHIFNLAFYSASNSVV